MHPFLLALSGLLVALSSCNGYHAAHQRTADIEPTTLSIPYVEGDTDGDLTNQVVKYLSESGRFRYVAEQGQYTLQIHIKDTKEENIGYRHDVDKTGKQLKRTIPDESRSKILAKVQLIENGSQKTILGPTHILASVDFDHQYYARKQSTAHFSLAQLSDIDTAHESVYIPRNRELARKIADYITNHLDWLDKEHAQNP